MKKSLLVVAIASLTLSTFAQQDPQFTYWMFDRQSFNPAAAGIDPMHCVSIFYRDQWDGFDRDPKTSLFNYSGNAMVKTQELGYGLTFFNDLLGQEKNNSFRLAIAPKFDLGNGMKVGVGLGLGMLNKKLGANWVYIDPDDSAIPNKEVAETKFDLSFGATLYGENFYAGLSATHLTAAEYSDLNLKSARHLYLMGGYNFPLSSQPIVIRTNALIKSDLKASPAIDLNANALWNNMVWGGLSYRFGDAISPMVGFEKVFPSSVTTKGGSSTTYNHALRLGYAYDVTTSEIRNYSSGSHEIFVTYCFSLDKVVVKLRHNNPRFL